MEPIIVQGVFKFGLKSIGKALYKNKLIQTTWDENDNGLDSMIQFKDICKKNDKKIPLKRKNVFIFSSIFTISFLFVRGIVEIGIGVFSIDLLVFLSCIAICEKFKIQK